MRLFDDMEIFATVAEAGGFSGAARALGLSRSRVSESVRALESRVGARLFDRSTRQVRPTEAGRALHARVRRAMDEARAGIEEVAALDQEPAGRLRVGVLPGFAELHVVPALEGFVRAHPRLQVELVESEAPGDLLEQGLDLAIRLVAEAAPSLIVRRIGSGQVIACATPDYLEFHGRPSHPNDIASHLCVSYGRLFWAREWHFSGPGGEVAVPVAPRLVCGSTTTLRAAALEGIGLTVLPDWAVAPEIASGRLVRVLEDWEMPKSGIYAVYPSNRMVTRRVRACVEHLARHLRCTEAEPATGR